MLLKAVFLMSYPLRREIHLGGICNFTERGAGILSGGIWNPMREVEGRGISISLRGNLESTKGDLEFTESDGGAEIPLGVIQNPLKGNLDVTERDAGIH